MRTTRTLLTLLIGIVLLSPAQAQKKLTAAEAKEHFGDNATACGEVVSTRYAASSKGQPTFLNLDKPYPNQIFTVVIWGNNRSKFKTPENDYKDKKICVTGKITAYDGLPRSLLTIRSKFGLNNPLMVLPRKTAYFLLLVLSSFEVFG